jgi:exosome complex RNA-binding protein Rrp4
MLKNYGFNIIVVNNGFVYVGPCMRDTEDNLLLSENCRNIRQWGTTGGLHQLCITGPTKESVIDAASHVTLPWHSIVSLHRTDEKLWKKK